MTEEEAHAGLAAALARMTALEEHVRTLERELRHAQQRVDLTMRGQLRCRACGCRRIAHARTVLDRVQRTGGEPLSLYQVGLLRAKTVGQLQAYACTGCGLVEWYVADPGALTDEDGHLEILEGESPVDPTPYR